MQARAEGLAVEPCPDEESLALLGEGRLPRERAARMAAHTEQCPRCRRLIALLTRLGSSGNRPGVLKTRK